jgi:triacylglycerol esterase/lipase EstA (alpha/beta hydrolase family)
MKAKLLRIGLAVPLLATSLLLSGSPPAAAAPSAGWNDWSCQPSSAHPNPVVLLHGFGGNDEVSWNYMAPYLVNSGFCVFSLTYGETAPLLLIPTGGTGPLHESSVEIAAFVDQVQAATGAAEVDLVGHSEGGLHALYIPKVLGRAADVGRVITLATDVHGYGPVQTTELLNLIGLRELAEAVAAGFDCRGCTDALPGSAYRQALADGPVAQPGVAYTLIFTRFDELALAFAPLGSPFLREPGVRNLYVQDHCPLDLVNHGFMPSSRSVASLVANTLDPAQPVRCSLVLPLGGIVLPLLP